jgi:hypothetical protein
MATRMKNDLVFFLSLFDLSVTFKIVSRGLIYGDVTQYHDELFPEPHIRIVAPNTLILLFYAIMKISYWSGPKTGELDTYLSLTRTDHAKDRELSKSSSTFSLRPCPVAGSLCVD